MHICQFSFIWSYPLDKTRQVIFRREKDQINAYAMKNPEDIAQAPALGFTHK